MTAITITPEYGYVAGAIVSTFWLNVWQMSRVGRARRIAKVPYPQLYAEKSEAAASPAAMQFNCAQRAHANTLETLPVVVVSTLINATKYPVYAAAALGAWTIFRVFYTIGYGRGPTKRNLFQGATVSIALAATMLLAATVTSASFIWPANQKSPSPDIF